MPIRRGVLLPTRQQRCYAPPLAATPTTGKINRPRMKRTVTPQQIADYQRDGAVCLRQVLNESELDLLRAGIEENLLHPSPRSKIASRPDDPGKFVEDFCCWQENEHYRRFIHETPLAAISGQLMESNSVRLY